MIRIIFFQPTKVIFRYMVGEFDLATGCVVNRDPRVLIHGRDILTVSLPDTSYGGTTAG